MKNKQVRPRLTPREYDALRAARGRRNVGVISDTHFPFCLPGYIEFCYRTFERFSVDTIVHIGDLVDNHAISYHESDPDGFSAGDEGDEARLKIAAICEMFPEVKLCIGNHDRLPERKAQTIGLPKRFIKTFKEAWDLPKGWDVQFRYDIDGVIYEHGTRESGKYAHAHRALKNMQNTVMGHVHSSAGVHFMASRKQLLWGLGVGCGVDANSYAAAYGREFAAKPIISCGLVLDNGRVPVCVPMDLS